MTPLSALELDIARAQLRPSIRASGFMVGTGLAGFTDELDRLVAEHVPPLLAVAPDLDDLDLQDEIAEALADAAAVIEAAAYHEEAVRRSPGLLHRGQSPALSLTGLPAYWPTVTEPREAALARQAEAIGRTICDGARIGAAKRELTRRRDADLPYLANPTPAAKAVLTRRLHGETAREFGFDGRIPMPPRVLITGAQGTGKTAAAVKALATVQERIAVRFAVPLLDKAEEALADYLAAAGPHSLPAAIVRGRSARDPSSPPGTTMCARHEAAELVSRAGLSVRTTMCSTCPMRDACGYRRQEVTIEAMAGIGVFFMASVGLFSASPAPAADLLILDERLAVEEVSTVALGVLCGDSLPYPGGEGLATYQAAHVTMEIVRDALAHPDQLAALRGEGVTAERLAEAIRLLRPLAEPAPIPAGLTDQQLKAALAERTTPAAIDALKLLRAVAAEFEQPRAALNGVSLPDRHGNVVVCRLKRLHGVGAASVLALDGTGNPELVRHVFGARTVHVEARVERQAKVKSPLGKLYSRQSITGAFADGTPIPSRSASSARLRQEIATVVAGLPGPCLVVAATQAEEALATELAADTPTAHYGALRGRNAWETCASVVTAGPAPIGLEDVENLARCYMIGDPKPFISSATTAWPDDHPYHDRRWSFWCTRMRRMRDGSLQPVEVPIHPDPRVQAVLEQIREAEIVQAVDRTRPIWNSREVVTLDSLVLDLTYDSCPSHRDLVAGGNVWERCMAALGIVPLGARDLAEARVFPTVKAAERALERTPRALIETTFEPRGVLIALYRRQGQRGSLSRAVIDPARHPDPRASLELLLGPLAWFELLPMPTPEPELPAPQPPAAARPIVVIAAPKQRQRRRAFQPPAPPAWQHNADSVASSAAPMHPPDPGGEALIPIFADMSPWLWRADRERGAASQTCDTRPRTLVTTTETE